ncbi:hypothetical protein ACFZAU_39305 [Streptomyces sp. NPDC008238]
MMPFGKESRFAPIAGRDIALTAARILASPEEHGGQVYALTGPVEYSHEELAAEVSRVLGRDLPYEQVTAATFLEMLGIGHDMAKLKHFEAVNLDQQEGLLAGISDTAPRINGRPLTTVEEFVNEHRSAFELDYGKPST